MSELSDRILAVIQKTNLSYGELSKITGYSKSALQRYATGETKKVPIDVIEAIASATGVEPKSIMGWDEPSATYEEIQIARRKARELHLRFPNITTDMIEKKTRTNYHTFRAWCSGNSDYFDEKLDIIADLYSVTVDYLTGREDKPLPSNIIPIDPNMEFVPIPIIGSVAAGMNCLAEENIIGYEPMLRSDLKGGGDYTFLTVQGDSMYPEFKDGDLALVRIQSSVDSGSYAVVIIDGEEGVIKRVVYGDDWIELRSINPMYPPRRFEGKDVTRVEVYGLVKDLKRKFN